MKVNLEQARKRAKELVKEGGATTLAEAQLLVARELGYRSWPSMVRLLANPNVAQVVREAAERGDRALELLERAPELREDPWVALSLGDASWVHDPAAPGGPLEAPPLFYVARSRVARDTVTAARDLLARGADPNSASTEEWTSLSFACSRGDGPLVQLLLEAGAEPNDNDSLYHSVEAPDPTCTRLLLEHGARVEGTNALAHALDYDRLERVQLLLEHLGESAELDRSLLQHAVRRRRSPAFVQLLVDHGADVSARDDAGLTAFQHAFRLGYDDVAEMLRALGSSTDVEPADLALRALTTGEGEIPRKLDGPARQVLIEVALRDVESLERVVEAVGPSFSARWGGGPRGTLLHQAAWFGRPDLVGLLLRRGADPNAEVETEYATPLGWAAVGSRYSRDHPDDTFSSPEADWVAVAKLLLEAGARVEPKDAEMARSPLADWLAAHVPDAV